MFRLKQGVVVGSLVVVYSYHHHSTEKIAEVFAQVLGCEVKTPSQVDPRGLGKFGLLGFGAGIESGKHYKPLLDLADKLPPAAENQKVFLFSTAGITSEKKLKKDHRALREKLQAKGYVVVDEFQCKGYNTNSFLKFVGGMNRGRPNEEDLQNAQEFALNLKQNL
ncbi:MAG: flavodoxin family protein [Candidatus Bathyarchaeota archaeon]|nr:flavodoxin family protein [Candidatus Bathyarchaeota archaeon]